MLRLQESILAAESCGEDIAKLDPSIPGNAGDDGWIKKYANLRDLSKKIATNCDEIVSLSESILEEKSRDLRIAAFFCRGLFHKNDFPGFAEGLRIYHTLLDHCWDKGLYPDNVPARLSNITILDKSLSQDLELKKDVKADKDTLVEIKEILDGISAFLKEKVPDKEISFQAVGRTINSLLSVSKPQSKPQPTGALQTRQTDATSTATSAPAELKSDLDAVKAIIKAARFFLEKDFRNIVPYRLLWSAFWCLFIPPQPDINTGKQVVLSVAPSKSRIEGFLRDEDWESAVKDCGAAFVNELEEFGGLSISLDIQRLLCTALQGLVSKYEKAGEKKERDAYENLHKLTLRETAMIVERFSDVTGILYSNQVPFADEQTKRWIEESVKPVFEPRQIIQQNPALSKESSEENPQIQEDFKKAVELLSKQKLEDALDLMQKGIDADSTSKGQFQRRLNLASLCLDAAQPGMARPVLEHLDEEIERFSLDQWEPDLCLQVWEKLKRCYQILTSQQQGAQQQRNNGFYQEKADRIFEKICRLDIRVAQALR